MFWVGLLALIVVLALLPILAERRRAPVGEMQRRAVPGGQVRLSSGVTHYRWQGPGAAADGASARPQGPVFVLIHGLSTSSYVWDGLLPELMLDGRCCLTYDLYGRGLSDRPPDPQGRSFFIRQLRELLQDQGLTEAEVVLVGYSMGGAIATIFAAEEPERVERLILIAPAGLGHSPGRFAELCRRMPYLGDWLNTVLGGIVLRRGIDATAVSAVPDIAARQRAETRTRGYLRSVLSSQRHLLTEPLEEEHGEVRRMFVPTLAVWAEADAAIPPQAIGRLAQANRDARHVVVPHAGHGLVHTHPRELADAIRAFLRET